MISNVNVNVTFTLDHDISIQGNCSFAVNYCLVNHRDVLCEILQSNLSVFLYIAPMVVLVCCICTLIADLFVQTLHLLCLYFDLVSVSTSWVLWCEPNTRNQLIVLFRKCSKTIVIDIFKITTKRKARKKNEPGNSLLLGNACSINCNKNRTTYSQGYLYD